MYDGGEDQKRLEILSIYLGVSQAVCFFAGAKIPLGIALGITTTGCMEVYGGRWMGMRAFSVAFGCFSEANTVKISPNLRTRVKKIQVIK